MKNIFKLAQDNLIYLSILTLFLVETTAISQLAPSAIKKTKITQRVLGASEEQTTNFSQLPVLHTNSFPILSAQGVIAVDINSGVTLYQKSPDTPLLPASTTKIMTALVTLEYYKLDDAIEVGNIKVDGQKMGLIKGEKITIRSLLNGLLIYSANDAAEVLANAYPGGRDNFISKMNEYVKILHLKHTHFTNPTGLDDPNHKSTARDLIQLSQFALRNQIFAEIVRTKEKTVTSIDGKQVYNLKNINQLLGEVDGVEGVKTGWTENARENLVTYVVRGDKKVLIAVLGSGDRFGETKELIDWIFTNYTWEEVHSP